MLTWVEVNSSAIRHNLKEYRRLIGRGCLLMPVIKANAYGHGFDLVARICAQSKEVDRVCVVNLNEALQLIKLKFKKPIIILSFYDLDKKDIIRAARAGVIFPLYTEKQAKILNLAGKAIRKQIKVHIKIDTGATRIGVPAAEAVEFAKKISARYKNLFIEGVFSHFASSEEDYLYTKHQQEKFAAVCDNLEKEGIMISVKHIACSAAIFSHPQSRENAVRLGLGLYGLYSNNEAKIGMHLKPALSWLTTVIQVKQVEPGTKIGYGGTYQTNKKTDIAIIPVGYWDGFDRRLSNNASVIIKGVKCPVVGRICMNLCMVYVTGLGVKEGDKAILIGRQDRAEITVDELADKCKTINYEIADRINPLLPRVEK